MALPKFGGKPKAWPDIRRGFKVIIGACIPAIEMARLRHALPEAASKFIMGESEPTEAWALLDTQFGNRDIAIVLTNTGLLMFKIPKGPG